VSSYAREDGAEAQQTERHADTLMTTTPAEMDWGNPTQKSARRANQSLRGR